MTCRTDGVLFFHSRSSSHEHVLTTSSKVEQRTNQEVNEPETIAGDMKHVCANEVVWQAQQCGSDKISQERGTPAHPAQKHSPIRTAFHAAWSYHVPTAFITSPRPGRRCHAMHFMRPPLVLASTAKPHHCRSPLALCINNCGHTMRRYTCTQTQLRKVIATPVEYLCQRCQYQAKSDPSMLG